MTKKEFLRAVQSRVARVAVSASAVRGQGNKGTVAAARSVFRRLDLTGFGVSQSGFTRCLEKQTKALLTKLPSGARHWGIARKLINIFLRDCLYNSYLSDAYRLRRAEKAFEIPLDSITAISLKRLAGRGKLPPWPGVKYVSPALNAKFQAAATDEAAKRRIARVHFDAVLWSQNRDDDTK